MTTGTRVPPRSDKVQAATALDRQPDVRSALLAGGPGAFRALQRTAGNRAVGALLARAPTACPAPPDPLGEWRTQKWLCEMRKAPIGDNTYTLATKGQRGAKGDARGRSVELVHQVLAHWLCHRLDVAARIKTPTGDRYTPASAAAVAAFQSEFSEPASGIDGIVGPSTLDLLDYYIHGGPVPKLADCGDPGPEPARPIICGEREPGEEAHSAATPLILEIRPPVRAGAHGRAVQDIRLSNFTVDDASLDKGTADRHDSETLPELARLLDPTVRSERDGTSVDCWKLISATVFGFADCREEPSLGALRSEHVRDSFPLSPIFVETPSRPMTKRQVSEVARRRNRSVLIKLELEQVDRIDLAGSILDDLLALVARRRAELLAGGTRKVLVDLAAILARDSDPESLDHQLLDRAAANELSDRPNSGDCDDWTTYNWRSARKALAAELASMPVVVEDLCGDGDLPVLEDFLEALDDGVLEPMERGIKALLRRGGWTASGALHGCACFAFRELRRRSRLAGDIYSALDEDDPVWEDTNPRLRDCYP